MFLLRSSRKGALIPSAAYLISAIVWTLFFPVGSQAWRQTGRPSAASSEAVRQSDFDSIDGAINALYESISFPEGKSPDWDRFRSLFFSAASPCIRMASDGVSVMDRESFIAFFDGRIKKGTLKSFAESEVGRTAEVYGGLAQVFSTYEKRANLADPGKPTRGINGLQLFFKDNRWWISSLTWQDELAGTPIPQKYLKPGHL